VHARRRAARGPTRRSNPSEPAEAPSLTVERNDGDITVVVEGDVDVARAPTLRPLFRDLLAERPARLVVDCASVGFVDSVGLGVLIGARLLAEQSASELVLRDASTALRSLLEITGLDSSFTAESTEPR
jgi:anti-sigma B factor antagonist